MHIFVGDIRRVIVAMIFALVGSQHAFAQTLETNVEVDVDVELQEVAQEVIEQVNHEILDFDLDANSERGWLSYARAYLQRESFLRAITKFNDLMHDTLLRQERNSKPLNYSELIHARERFLLAYDILPQDLQPKNNHRLFQRAWNDLIHAVEHGKTPTHHQIVDLNISSSQFVGKMLNAYTFDVIPLEPTRNALQFYGRLRSYLRFRILEIFCDSILNHGLSRDQITQLIQNYGKKGSYLESMYKKVESKLHFYDHEGFSSNPRAGIRPSEFTNQIIVETLNLLILEAKLPLTPYDIPAMNIHDHGTFGRAGYERSLSVHENAPEGLAEKGRIATLVGRIRSIK